MSVVDEHVVDGCGEPPAIDGFPQGHFPVVARDFYTGTNVMVFLFAEEDGVSMVLPVGVSRVEFGVDQIEQVRRKLRAGAATDDEAAAGNRSKPAVDGRAEAGTS